MCGTFPDGPFIRTGFAWPEHSYFFNEAVKKKACSRAPCSKDGDPKWDEARFEGRARGVSWLFHPGEKFQGVFQGVLGLFYFGTKLSFTNFRDWCTWALIPWGGWFMVLGRGGNEMNEIWPRAARARGGGRGGERGGGV